MKYLRTSILPVFVAFAAHDVSAQSRAQVALAERYHVEFEYRRWRPSLASDLEVGGGPIYPVTDLGWGDERSSEYRGSFRVSSRLRLRASYVSPLNYEGSLVASRDLTFRGISFPAGSQVDSTMKLEYFKGGVSVEFLQSQDGFLGVTVDYARLESQPSLTGPAARTAATPLRITLPTVGFAGRAYLTQRFAITVEASGMKWESHGGVIAEFEGGLALLFNPRFGLVFGYRNSYSRITEGGRATYRLKGPYFGATIKI